MEGPRPTRGRAPSRLQWRATGQCRANRFRHVLQRLWIGGECRNAVLVQGNRGRTIVLTAAPGALAPPFVGEAALGDRLGDYAVAPVKMITPLPRFSIDGTTACAAINAPNVVTRQVFSKVLGLVSISLPNGRIAAL